MVIEGFSESECYGSRDVKLLTRMAEYNASSQISKQFDAVFLQSLLKSTRIEQHFSSIIGKSHGIFQHTPDDENTDKVVLTSGGNIAALLEKQLEQMIHHPSIITAPIFNTSPETCSPQQPAVSATHLANKTGSIINQSMDDFVKSIWPYAKQASHLIGLDPKILVAQAALETGWGQFIAKDLDGASSNNLFNIKSSVGTIEKSVHIQTTEYIDDRSVKTGASFKKYLSVEHSFNDYIALITNDQRYKTALAHVDDPKRYIDALQGAGYATDPNYANKIYAIYQGNELQHALERNGCAGLIGSESNHIAL